MGKETIAEQARKAGINPATVYNRVHSGWPLEKALNTPSRLKKAPKKKTAKKKAVKKAPVVKTEPDTFDRDYTWIVIGVVTLIVILAVALAGK